MSDPITSFRGEHRFLSNFWPATVTLDGMAFRSTEHAYQAAKTTDMAERSKFQVVKTPGAAKRLGRRIKLRPDWESVKEAVMLDLNRQKFSDPELAERLLGTGDAELIEGNTWGDRIWGMTLENGRWIGQNLLGRILMRVREELRKGGG
jgi:ribA/ribD-fused uncharacterized protein